MIFDGQGSSTTATLRASKTAQIELIPKFPLQQSPPPTINIHLGLSLSKQSSIELSLQKSVELGATQITPLITDFSQVKTSLFKNDSPELIKKMARWQDIVIQSCQQCQQDHIPTLNPVVHLPNWLDQTKAELKWVLDPRGHDINTTSLTTQPNSIAFATGPEGGFSESELQQADQAQFQVLKLGPRILRAETAPMVGLSLIQFHYGDMRPQPETRST